MEAIELTYSTQKMIPILYLKIVEGYQCQYESYDKILSTSDFIKKHSRLEYKWIAKNKEC